MFQPKLRRTFAVAAFTALTLSPLSGLEAAPLKTRQQGEERVAERFEQREVSLWRLLLSVPERLGARIESSRSKLGVRIDDNGLKLGVRIDDNG